MRAASATLVFLLTFTSFARSAWSADPVPPASTTVSNAVSASVDSNGAATKTQASSQVVSPTFSDPALAAEFTKVNALSQGFTSNLASTGTRGSGDLPTVNQESLKNYISSGQLKTTVLERIKSIDGSTTVFQVAQNAWNEMRARGLEKDINDSQYSPSVSCDSGTTPGAGASTQSVMSSDVCWNLSYLVTNHASIDTLVVLAVHAEAIHFGYGEDVAFLVGEMVGTALP